MEKIFVRFKSPIAVILLLILIGGAFSYQNMKTSLFPNVTFPKIKIIAENGEQPVEKMMVMVTKPLENAIKGVDNLQLIRSTTSMGSCEISAFMNWNSNIDLDKQQVESEIAQIKNDLPPEVQISVEKMNPSIFPIMEFSLQSDTKNPIELKMIAQYIVRPYLSRVSGVSSVQVVGGKEKEYRIVLDEKKLNVLKINPLDIQKILQQTDFVKSTGHTVDYNRLYLTVTDATLKNIDQLKELVIFDNGIRKVKIGDVSTVQISERNEYIKIKANGKNVPLITVLKQPKTNLIDVSNQVSAKIDELNKILPKGVQLKPYYNQSEFVKSSIRSIIDVLWIGLALAIFVVLMFLRSYKAGSVLLVTIPLTLALTFISMAFIGFDFNIMTIGAIAASIGLIIDDAIIVVEQIHRTHEEFPDKTPKELVGKAVHFLLPAMVSSSLSTIVILIPFELMSGVAGAYFKILTETMILTLVCSFVVTWLGLPVIYLLFSKDRGLSNGEKIQLVKHRPWIEIFITRPFISIGFVIVLIVGLVIMLPKLETGFLPEMDEGSIVLDYNSPPGTSLEETDRMLTEVDKILETTAEVKTYSRQIGTQNGFFITEPNRGDFMIELKKNRSKNTEQVSNDIRMRIEKTLPALKVDFGQQVSDMLGDLMSSVQPVEVKIFGDSKEKLQALSKQIADSIKTIKGTADVFDGIVVAGPMLRILPKEEKLKQFGLNPADLQAQMQTYISGVVIGSIPEKEQLTDIRMIFPQNNKTPIEKVKDAKVCTATGDYIPVSQMADFNILSGVTEIERENLQTMGVVTSRLNNRDLGSVMKDIQKSIKKINLPPSYQIEYGGSYAQQQQSFDELLKILLIAALLVFAVVLFMFKDLKLSLTVIFISSLGVVGGVFALFITDSPLNVGSYTGLIMIVGIIGENCIFTIQQFLTILKNSTVNHALIYSISARLRPKLMTATGAIVALIPLALGIGSGAQMHQSLAIAVIGGLLLALPLLLIVLPSMLKVLIKKKADEELLENN